MAGRNTKVFISYSRRDREFATRLSEALEAGAGITVYRDTEDILPTEEWKHRLEHLIADADTVIFALSRHSAVSEVCNWEVDYAASLHKRIAPIVIEDVAPEHIPERLTKHNYIFCTERDDFDKALSTLVAALNTDIEWIREHTRLGDLARRWDARGKSAVQLLRGGELAEAEEWLARQPETAPAPTRLHRHFIGDGRRVATRRQRVWIGGSIAAAVMAIVLAGFALVQKREADAQRTAAIEQRNVAETNLRQALKAADTLVFEIANGLRDFSGVPAQRIRSVLERAEEVLNDLEGTGTKREVAQRRAIMLHVFVDAYMTLGDLGEASKRALRAMQIMQRLVAHDPDNLSWQHDLMLSQEKTGDVRLAQGNLSAALQAYLESLNLARRRAGADPGNAARQRALSVSHNKVGRVLVIQGKLPDALNSYRASLVIAQRLSALDPDNAEWQRDLAVSHGRVGNVRKAQGNYAAALDAYRAGHAIIERLAASNPDNAKWRRDASISLKMIGDVQFARAELADALKSYQDSHAVIERLAASDPANAVWQRDLSASFNNVGSAQMAQADMDGAMKSFRSGLAIAERLVASDATNALWQRGLAVSYNKVGAAQMAQGHHAEAETSFRNGLEIAERLSASDPGNANWRRDLSLSHEQMARLRKAQGDFAGALESYRAGLAIIETLAGSDPKNAGWRRMISISFDQIGEVLVAQSRLPDALPYFRDSLAIRQALATARPQDVGGQRDLAGAHWRLAQYGAQPKRHWRRVIEILNRLEAEGSLPSSDRKWLPVAERELAAVQQSMDTKPAPK